MISGIPISFLKDADAEAFVRDCASALSPNGCVLIYQVSPRVLPLLKANFRKVKWKMELGNFPPYQVFLAQAPSRPQSQKSGDSITASPSSGLSTLAMHRGSLSESTD